MYEIGRVLIKIAGRDARKKAVIVEMLEDNYVLIDGETRRKKCNIKHVEPLDKVINIKKGASHKEVVEAFRKELDIEVPEKKPKQAAESPKKQKKEKVKQEKPAKDKKKKPVKAKKAEEKVEAEPASEEPAAEEKAAPDDTVADKEAMPEEPAEAAAEEKPKKKAASKKKKED
ncbi:MAG: 50S ribosomal protein L14e [Nanoarchaeota archaeon]|nr:50S ribosomal protein L14e [Nanoarchaeota archaeon]